MTRRWTQTLPTCHQQSALTSTRHQIILSGTQTLPTCHQKSALTSTRHQIILLGTRECRLSYTWLCWTGSYLETLRVYYIHVGILEFFKLKYGLGLSYAMVRFPITRYGSYIVSSPIGILAVKKYLVNSWTSGKQLPDLTGFSWTEGEYIWQYKGQYKGKIGLLIPCSSPWCWTFMITTP